MSRFVCISLLAMVVLINVVNAHYAPGLVISSRISPLLSTYEGHLGRYRHNHHHRHRYHQLEHEFRRIRELERELLEIEASGVGLLEPDYYFDVERRLERHELRLAEILD
ncbi:unnamed protein product [Oppiella nova]|uniref:Uncharacterized protein n=1 Tax=Oppiella nova TaxID=334625 RepID=A0A7R9MHC4_9ACAR|nr:unnamed protein product [Oppiella nova]CAG2177282.1 unnamed protein product [Oppiella nova]